jgi:hypothetical protein
LFKELDKLDGPKEIRVLGGDLDNDLEVSKRLFSGELAKVVD